MQYGISDFQILSVSEKVEYTLTENIRLSNVEKLWELGYDGEGMHIAVLDTGCDVNHKCLKDRIVETKNFVNGTDDVTDKNGHGTHVAGIIAGNQCKGGISGIAPKDILITSTFCSIACSIARIIYFVSPEPLSLKTL